MKLAVIGTGIAGLAAAWERCVERVGLKIGERDFHGQDYARTLRAWDKQVQATEPAIRALDFDTRFLRMRHYYLAYCQAGFATGHVDLMQTLLVRDD